MLSDGSVYLADINVYHVDARVYTDITEYLTKPSVY